MSLMFKPGLLFVEGGCHGEDRLAMLHGDHAAGSEASAVANAVHVVDDRHRGIAGAKEVSVKRMRQAAIHRAVCGHQCLADHLPAEHALPADLRAQAPEQILFEPLDVEDGEELVEGAAHDKAFRETRPRPLAVSLRIRNVALLCDA
jgi:hypothetical protein